MHLRSWQALAVLWCAQTPVVNRAVDTQGNRLGEPFSTCTSYRRPLSRSLEDCLRFCPAIEESCAAAPALAHCEARCREIHPSTYCEVLTISGLQEGATNWPAKVDDLNTRYRMLVRQCTSGDAHCRAYCRAHCPSHHHAQCRAPQTKLEKPIIINGRPTYRSIPSRRSGFRPVRKIDYYLYSTAINGYVHCVGSAYAYGTLSTS